MEGSSFTVHAEPRSRRYHCGWTRGGKTPSVQHSYAKYIITYAGQVQSRIRGSSKHWYPYVYEAMVQDYATFQHYAFAVHGYTSAGYFIFTGVFIINAVIYFGFGGMSFPGGINDLGEEETEATYK